MKAFSSILLLSLLGRGLADLTQAQVGKLLAGIQPNQPGTSSCMLTVSTLIPRPPIADRIHKQCSILNIALSGKVSFPNSTIYDLENAYWSEQQAEINSTCRVTPTSSIDVSLTLYVLEFLQCEFAVKSGGHAAFVGASNIKDGVTIDMANLSEIVVSEDETVTSLGPGNRWVDVYTRLEPLNLSVVGGRTADIGVGGLLLGGGISFFSQRFGFACDNVLNYEVLLYGILSLSLLTILTI